MYNRIEDELQSVLKKNIRVYSTTEDFISDYTKVDIVKLENYKMIFQVFVLTLLSMFMGFTIHKYRQNLPQLKLKKLIYLIFQ